jgi:hypothetical protein
VSEWVGLPLLFSSSIVDRVVVGIQERVVTIIIVGVVAILLLFLFGVDYKESEGERESETKIN